MLFVVDTSGSMAETAAVERSLKLRGAMRCVGTKTGAQQPTPRRMCVEDSPSGSYRDPSTCDGQDHHALRKNMKSACGSRCHATGAL